MAVDLIARGMAAGKNSGRFLSLWDCSTGLPVTNPLSMPYEYKTGDYFRVSKIATGSGSNYKPSGSSYSGTASSTVESESINIGWTYYYDGAQWISERSGTVVWGSIAGELSDQDDLQDELDSKVDTDDYNPDTKTAAMTQAVGKDSNGKLWTTPELPAVTAADNGKILMVINGVWTVSDSDPMAL